MGKETMPQRITAHEAAVTADLAPNVALPWVLRLRYGMVAGEAAMILGMFYGFRLRLPILWIFAPPLAIILISNILLGRWRTLPFQFPQETLGAVFCLDTLCLTTILGLTGGPMNPFSLLYLVQIMLSAMVLNKVWTWILGFLSTFAFGLLFWFNKPIAAFSPHHAETGLTLHLAGMWIAFAIAALLITFFIGKVSEAVRQHEREVLDLRDRLARSQRLASLVTLAAGAAHELGTPLSTIAVVAKELERAAAIHDGPESDGITAILDDARLIRAEVARCRLILQRMSADGAETPGEAPVPVPLSQILAGVAARFDRYPELKVASHNNAGTSQILVLPRDATIQAVSALVKNALDANIDHREVILKAQIEDGRVRFVVEDKGEGMTPEVLSHLAEPFFTTKAPGFGMGLGTFLVRMFAEHLEGRLFFDSTPGRGSTAVLEFPAELSADSFRNARNAPA